MTTKFRTLFDARKAVETARLHGYNCRHIMVCQSDDSDIVRVIQGDASIYLGSSILYTGRPTRALAFIACEYNQLSS